VRNQPREVDESALNEPEESGPATVASLGGVSDFTGFPEAALDFYDDLEMDNTKSFWEAHKTTYLESVKAPMVALTEALSPEFGAAKVFRPFRDVRFAKEKSTVNAPLAPRGPSRS
jgi:uncharacterized protein (DUF2461 family)